MEINDLAGKIVSQAAADVIQGQQNIGLNIQHLGAGIYTVTLTLKGQQMHVKLIKR